MNAGRFQGTNLCCAACCSLRLHIYKRHLWIAIFNFRQNEPNLIGSKVRALGGVVKSVLRSWLNVFTLVYEINLSAIHRGSLDPAALLGVLGPCYDRTSYASLL